ncbi:MAG: helix-turn-helix domain-containing protein [Candidatus Omnitrophota bacterium]
MSQSIIYLRQWRRHKGLTQMQLSRRSGLTQSAISNIENQARHINTRSLSRLSRGLNLSLARLFSLPRNRPLPQGRRRIDRLARCIVDGRFAGNPADDRLCRDIGSLIINKLRAHEKEGRKRYRTKRWNVLSRYLLMEEKYSPCLVRQILARIDKLL